MTSLEAYQFTLEVVKQLQNSGIKVTVSEASKRPEMVSKYNGPERVDSNVWVNVQFHPTSREQSDLIYSRVRELNRNGIHFDTGGGDGLRDWELDWSFKFIDPKGHEY